VFLCLPHHDEYDSRTSQSKGITISELKQFRNELYEYVELEKNLVWADYLMETTDVNPATRISLRPDVYDRKIQVYRTVRDFLSLILRDADVTTDNLLTFARDTDEARFIFDKELEEFLRELYKRAVSLHYTNKRLADRQLPVGQERSRLADENAEVLKWFLDQLEVSREHFYKRISLE